MAIFVCRFFANVVRGAFVVRPGMYVHALACTWHLLSSHITSDRRARTDGDTYRSSNVMSKRSVHDVGSFVTEFQCSSTCALMHIHVHNPPPTDELRVGCSSPGACHAPFLVCVCSIESICGRATTDPVAPAMSSVRLWQSQRRS